uniref:Uncharacterized protein n=1 Tax=Candidatus Kentrum sp. DK TaxID=2126562 RepID=A0A450SP58_9GAMM|nr:MAG: hypothetical protein BECKDK2373C_GA0170839_104928 [Candidatus Kentron sp. DK]
MNDINLRIAAEEANLILESLGNMPFARVYGLVGKIQEQARRQIGGEDGPPEQTPADKEPAPTENQDIN